MCTLGNVYGWGWNKYGQLGASSQEKILEPIQLDVSGPAQTIECGMWHSIVLVADTT